MTSLPLRRFGPFAVFHSRRYGLKLRVSLA